MNELEGIEVLLIAARTAEELGQIREAEAEAAAAKIMATPIIHTSRVRIQIWRFQSLICAGG